MITLLLLWYGEGAATIPAVVADVTISDKAITKIVLGDKQTTVTTLSDKQTVEVTVSDKPN